MAQGKKSCNKRQGLGDRRFCQKECPSLYRPHLVKFLTILLSGFCVCVARVEGAGGNLKKASNFLRTSQCYFFFILPPSPPIFLASQYPIRLAVLCKACRFRVRAFVLRPLNNWATERRSWQRRTILGCRWCRIQATMKSDGGRSRNSANADQCRPPRTTYILLPSLLTICWGDQLRTCVSQDRSERGRGLVPKHTAIAGWQTGLNIICIKWRKKEWGCTVTLGRWKGNL